MQIIVINQTSNTLSYVNGQVSIPPNGQSYVSSGIIPYLVLDPSFRRDVGNGYIQISDTLNMFSGASALEYLKTWLANGVPQNSNDPVAFTLAGLGFSSTGNLSLSNTTETPVLLLTNPSTNNVSARAMFLYAAPNSTQGIVTINIYINPTVSSNGTQIPTQNNLVSATAPASAMVVYGGPTISNMGTKRITVVTNANSDSSLFNFAQTAILTPGNNMLMTLTVSNIGLLSSVNTYFYMQWVEA